MTHLNPELIESLFGDTLNDRTRQLLRLLTQDPSTEPAEDAPDEREWDNRPGRGGRRSHGRTLRRLGVELEELRHRNEALAHALGACPNCWGETEECEDCAGEGSPGTYDLDHELFEAVVMPAVARREGSRRPDAGNTQHHPNTPADGGSET